MIPRLYGLLLLLMGPFRRTQNGESRLHRQSSTVPADNPWKLAPETWRRLLAAHIRMTTLERR